LRFTIVTLVNVDSRRTFFQFYLLPSSYRISRIQLAFYYIWQEILTYLLTYLGDGVRLLRWRPDGRWRTWWTRLSVISDAALSTHALRLLSWWGDSRQRTRLDRMWRQWWRHIVDCLYRFRAVYANSCCKL